MSARDWPARACGKAAPLLLLALAGCTTATVELTPDGVIRAQFSRFATDAALHLSPDTLDYSSAPSAAAQQQMTDALVRALGLLATSGSEPHATSLPARLRSPEPSLFTGGPT